MGLSWLALLPDGLLVRDAPVAPCFLQHSGRFPFFTFSFLCPSLVWGSCHQRHPLILSRARSSPLAVAPVPPQPGIGWGRNDSIHLSTSLIFSPSPSLPSLVTLLLPSPARRAVHVRRLHLLPRVHLDPAEPAALGHPHPAPGPYPGQLPRSPLSAAPRPTFFPSPRAVRPPPEPPSLFVVPHRPPPPGPSSSGAPAPPSPPSWPPAPTCSRPRPSTPWSSSRWRPSEGSTRS